MRKRGGQKLKARIQRKLELQREEIRKQAMAIDHNNLCVLSEDWHTLAALERRKQNQEQGQVQWQEQGQIQGQEQEQQQKQNQQQEQCQQQEQYQEKKQDQEQEQELKYKQNQDEKGQVLPPTLQIIEKLNKQENDIPKLSNKAQNDESRRSQLADITIARTKRQSFDTSSIQLALKRSAQLFNTIPLIKSAESIPEPLIKQQKNTYANIERKSQEVDIDEQELRVEHIRQIMDQEASAAEIELQRKKNLLDYDELIQNMTVKHIQRMHELEHRHAALKIELIELQIQKEKEKTEN